MNFHELHLAPKYSSNISPVERRTVDNRRRLKCSITLTEVTSDSKLSYQLDIGTDWCEHVIAGNNCQLGNSVDRALGKRR